jgi:hypothetical protein
MPIICPSAAQKKKHNNFIKRKLVTIDLLIAKWIEFNSEGYT